MSFGHLSSGSMQTADPLYQHDVMIDCGEILEGWKTIKICRARI
jgi:hypothetical protein